MLVDTPGIFAPRRRLDRAMVAAAWEGAQDADVIALVVDAKAGLRDQVEAILDSIAKRSGVKFLVPNKVAIRPQEKQTGKASCWERYDREGSSCVDYGHSKKKKEQIQ